MGAILVDACGWTSLIDAGLNLDIALSSVIGNPELKITEGVKNELDRLSKSNRGLLLSLLYKRSEVIESGEGHTDDELLSISSRMKCLKSFLDFDGEFLCVVDSLCFIFYKAKDIN